MLNDEGEELWSKSYGGIFDDIGYSVTIAADGGFVIGGLKTITPTTNQAYLIKTDKNGELEWERLI